jgi:hypothetical protein
MPQAVAILFDFAVTAIETFGPALAGEFGIGSQIAAATIAAAGLYELNSVLAPSTPSPAAQNSTIRQPIPPRYRGCGVTRMGGAFLLDFASGQNLRQVVAFADCIVAVRGFYLNQDEVSLSGNQVITFANGAYSRVKLYTAFGVSYVTAFPTLNAAYPAVWPSTCYGAGVFMGLVETSNGKIEQFTKDFPRGPSLQFNIVGAIDVQYDWRDGSQSRTDPSTWRNSANPVVCLINELWRYRDHDWDLDFAPTLSLLTAEANVCDEAVPVRNILSKVTVEANPGANVIRVKSIDGLTTGRPVIVAGQSFTLSSFGASHPDGYDLNLSGGLYVGVAAGALVRWISNPASPLTRPRYTANGRWVVGEAEADTVKRFLECMDGWMGRRGSDGALVVRAGRAVSPTVTIGLDEIIDYVWDGFVDLGKVVNELVPNYVEPANDFNQVDTTPWRDDDSVSVDGLSSQAFQPGLVQSNSQVRRLAKARMARMQQPARSLVLKASGLRCLGERFLAMPAAGLEIDEMNGAVLEVVGDIEIIDNGMHVSIPVQVFDAACYDWDYLTEEGNGPADVAAPQGVLLTAPTLGAPTLVFDTVISGQAGVRLSVGATGPNRDDLTWSYRTRVHGTTSWHEATDRSLVGGSVTILTDYVAADASIDVEAAYMNGAGVLSPWSAPQLVSTSIDTVAPDGATAPTLASWDATLRLTAPPIPRARTYRWRIYMADGVTLIATKSTASSELSYGALDAATDGVQRSYVIKLAGVNGAGVGTEASISVSKAAPGAPSTTTASGGATTGEVDFASVTGTVGYLVSYADTSGFDPVSYGAAIKAGSSPAYLNGLPAGTFYAKVAAFDAWSANPALLNFGSQASFVITSGGGPTPPGGGGGGGAGGRGGGGGGLTEIP